MLGAAIPRDRAARSRRGSARPPASARLGSRGRGRGRAAPEPRRAEVALFERLDAEGARRAPLALVALDGRAILQELGRHDLEVLPFLWSVIANVRVACTGSAARGDNRALPARALRLALSDARASNSRSSRLVRSNALDASWEPAVRCALEAVQRRGACATRAAPIRRAVAARDRAEKMGLARPRRRFSRADR